MKNGPYGASEAAVNNLTNSFSNEMAPRVRVNAVAPGPIATQNFIDSMKMHTPEREAELKGMMNLPMDRFGEPEDIGAAVLFMASDASSWITGQTIFVTGGS
jgi:7-alpha-hydroxysteroid dehydrogenase